MSAGYVFQWLERIGLGYAVPNFMQLGVDTPQKLMLIDVKTYDALGIVDRELFNCALLLSHPYSHHNNIHINMIRSTKRMH